MRDLTIQQQEALDYLVDMARGHDYAEVAKISAAEDVLFDALTDRAQMLADERERIAQAIEAHAERTLPTWLRDNYLTAARIAREAPDA